MNHNLKNNYTSVRNVRQVIEVRRVCMITPTVNIKVFVIPVNTRQSSLKTHQESVHEGVRYSCKYCGYKVTSQSSLKQHQESIHEGVNYECDQCDYLATQQSHLKRHKKSVHKLV